MIFQIDTNIICKIEDFVRSRAKGSIWQFLSVLYSPFIEEAGAETKYVTIYTVIF